MGKVVWLPLGVGVRGSPRRITRSESEAISPWVGSARGTPEKGEGDTLEKGEGDTLEKGEGDTLEKPSRGINERVRRCPPPHRFPSLRYHILRSLHPLRRWWCPPRRCSSAVW